MKHIRDPLYGYIGVTPAELRVIGTPAVQRLRYIHQLGLSSAVYPGATHTRFEHSLGVMYLAGQLAESLALSEGQQQAYRLAGLLHDVGHAPFSHATEVVMEERLGISHEEQSCRVVDGIANAMDGEFPADPALVKAAIRGESQYNIVAGAVDADRMDYLRRDATETGIPHGEIDTETIIQFADTHGDEVVFSYKSLQAIEDLFNARTAMGKSVYQHHVSTIVELMLQRAVERFLDKTGTDPHVLLRWDDRQLHTHLLELDGVANRMYTLNGEMGEWMAPLSSVAEESLYGRVTTRDLYKRAYTVGVRDIGRDALRELETSLTDVHQVEREIAEVANVSVTEVLVDPPHTPSTAIPDVGILVEDEVVPLSELSEVPGILADSEWGHTQMGVYAPQERRDAVADAAQQVLF